MSPEAKASAAALARLRQELAEDRAAMGTRVRELADVVVRWAPGAEARQDEVLVGAYLHAWYTGLETAIERIIRELDGAVPAGERSHRELLSQAMVEVPGARPPILSRSLHPELVALLSFRHFFRHAYGLSFDSARLRAEAERLLRIEGAVSTDLDRFDRFLVQTLRSLGES